MRFATAFGDFAILFGLLGILIELIAVDLGWDGGWIIAVGAWLVGLYFAAAGYYESKRTD